MSMITVSDLRKSFAGEPVLDGVTFSVEKGETVAVIGPSGAVPYRPGDSRWRQHPHRGPAPSGGRPLCR